jgi:hypothetical protein
LRNIPVVGLSLIFPPTTRLSKKAPDFGEAKALMDTMREEGIPHNVFTYSTRVIYTVGPPFVLFSKSSSLLTIVENGNTTKPERIVY